MPELHFGIADTSAAFFWLLSGGGKSTVMDFLVLQNTSFGRPKDSKLKITQFLSQRPSLKVVLQGKYLSCCINFIIITSGLQAVLHTAADFDYAAEKLNDAWGLFIYLFILSVEWKRNVIFVIN